MVRVRMMMMRCACRSVAAPGFSGRTGRAQLLWVREVSRHPAAVRVRIVSLPRGLGQCHALLVKFCRARVCECSTQALLRVSRVLAPNGRHLQIRVLLARSVMLRGARAIL